MFYFSQASYADIERGSKASDVGGAYAEGISSVCCQVASSFLVHPADRDNGRLIGWDHNPYQHVDVTHFHDENIILGLMDFPDKELQKFSADSRERLRELRKRFPVFALGMFLCPNAQWCLEEIDALVPAQGTTERTTEFPWLVNSAPTGHAPTPGAIRPADADTLLWHFPKSTAPALTSLCVPRTGPEKQSRRFLREWHQHPKIRLRITSNPKIFAQFRHKVPQAQKTFFNGHWSRPLDSTLRSYCLIVATSFGSVFDTVKHRLSF
ncbi:hypothetical protein CPB85DRAFT_393730 [Mucidula mucida]|nr:hypothetical protein CPB85DRAFT_393730 [Mucidula mucida]